MTGRDFPSLGLMEINPVVQTSAGTSVLRFLLDKLQNLVQDSVSVSFPGFIALEIIES